ncbi:aldose 1-epimerase family protein [Microbacterium sp. PA5]|uniref:aldose 1-epimerase family protein n=1 Tax=Microbacterium sp. PA5 TaxID=3416654 RepID=UPI003CF37ABE
MARTPLSGTQYTLRAGDDEAVIASVGASLRAFRHAGRDLVVPFEADEVRPAYRGATLAPWPNRIVDGRYSFAGVDYQTALTEPERGQALHGLVAWLDFDAVDRGVDHVTLAATIEPQLGYPWRVRVETRYELSAAGLSQTVTARNESATAAPFGTGPHPYLVAGPHPLDEWTLSLPADRVLQTTPDRLSPTELVGVETDAERFDFRTEREIGAVEIDHAYTGLVRDGGGGTAVIVRDVQAGTGVAIEWDAACAWVQVHTADQPEGPASPAHRAGLAVEPMTCAPDAFNAAAYPFDTGLLVLEPGEAASASWRIRAL